MIRPERDEPRACASVLATTKSTPDRPEAIILLIALPPAPPTPHTTMRGFSSFSWGAFRPIGISRLSCWALESHQRHRQSWPVKERLFHQRETCDAGPTLSGPIVA